MTGSSLHEAHSDRSEISNKKGGTPEPPRYEEIAGFSRWRSRRTASHPPAVIGCIIAWGVFLVFLFGASASRLFAQESPYIVTYDHHLEEPGNLEVEYF